MIRTERILLYLDAVLLAVCFIGSYIIRFWSGFFSTHYGTPCEHYLIAQVVLSLLYLSSLWFFGGYETRRPPSLAAQMDLTLRAVTLASLIFLSLVFWYRFFSFSRMVMLMNGVSLVLISSVCRWAVLKGAAYYRRKGYDLANALLIFSEQSDRRIEEFLKNHPEYGYALCCAIPVKEIKNNPGKPGRALYPLFEKYNINDLFLDLGPKEGQEAAEFIEQCRQEPVRLHFTHGLYREIRPHPRWRVLDDGEWYTLERTPWDRLSQALKRAMDIVISIIVLVLFSPVMALIALGIRLSGRGPIIFRQERAGLNGRPFTIYKFRSMVEEAEQQLDQIVDVESLSQPVFKLVHDPRVTPLG